MDTAKIFGLLLILGLEGCLSSIPAASIPDPFHVALIANAADSAEPPFSIAPSGIVNPFESGLTHSSLAQADSTDLLIKQEQQTHESTSEALPSQESLPHESPDVLADEFLLESEESVIISEEEQIGLLSENNWVRNTALINLLDEGEKSSVRRIVQKDQQRRDEINLLNMSREELAKRNNQRYEYVDGSVSDWRWMHQGVEKLCAMPPDRRVSPDVFLRHAKYQDKKYKMLRYNATILIGRDGNPQIKDRLLQMVKDELVPVPIRSAAAEVLGTMPTITVDDLLPLIDLVKERTVPVVNRQTGEETMQYQPGNTDVWTELLIALAKKKAPWELDCFLEPFHASTYDIRIQAAKIWRKEAVAKRPDEKLLPEMFLMVAKRETNPAMRIELIKTLGACGVSDLFSFLERDLNHSSADVRHAAMLALAESGAQEAVPFIKEQLKDANPLVRAAAAAAMRKLGNFDEVFKLSTDSDQRVRTEIAKALSERCTKQTLSLAKDYLTDRYAMVQSATVEAIAHWNIETSGPLLLLAAKSKDKKIRHRAIEILAQHGVSNPLFDPEGLPAKQAEEHEELMQIFYETVGVDPYLDEGGNMLSSSSRPSATQKESTVPPNSSVVQDADLDEVRQCLVDWQNVTLPPHQRELILNRLKSFGDQLMPMIDHIAAVEHRAIPLSLDCVFADWESSFEQIQQLYSDDLYTKQRAAAELAKSGAGSEMSQLAVKRIVDRVYQESDPQVLISLMAALKNANHDTVRPLALPLLESQSPRVRREACEMLKEFGKKSDLPILQKALGDTSREVVLEAFAAVDSIVQAEEFDSSDMKTSSIAETLKTILLHADPSMQTKAAAVLHRLGKPEGTEALRRLAASPDNRVRVYAAQVVSELGDPSFLPMLLSFLDDGNGTLRNEALKGLPKLAGKDIGRVGTLSYTSEIPATQQQIDRWKAWANERGM